MKENISCYDRIQALIRSPEFLKESKEEGLDPEVFLGSFGLFGGFQITNLKNLRREDYSNDDFFMYEDIIRAIGYKEYGEDSPEESKPLRESRYLLLELDLYAKKKDLLERVEMQIKGFSRYVENKPKTRSKPEKNTDKFVIWDMYKKNTSFTKIAKQLKEKPSTVRKAYFRAFELIIGEPYNPLKHNRKAISKFELAKTCDTCSGLSTCETLCSDVAAFVKQDYGSRLGMLGRDKAFEG
jgi:hypothetical protein